jgi:pimeloyl-ACP methyl ester carboxylesterase
MEVAGAFICKAYAARGLGHTAAMPSILLIPGLACDAGLFAHQCAVLPGAVVAQAHADALTIAEMAALLLAAHPGELLPVGCSMGGMVALEMARQAPRRVRALALLGSSARPDTPQLIALRTQAIAAFEAGRLDEVLRANVMFAFHPLHAAQKPLVEAYMAMVRRAGVPRLVSQNRAVMARADLRPALHAITCPALLACGEADGLTPPEQAREMAALLPQAKLEIVPGAGHMLTLEQPARVTALLQHWLASISA